MNLTAAKVALVDIASLVIFVYLLVDVVWKEVGPGVGPILVSAIAAFTQWFR